MNRLVLLRHTTEIHNFDSQKTYLSQKDKFTLNHGIYCSNRVTRLWYYYNKNDEFICLKYEEFKYNDKSKTENFYIKYIDTKSKFIKVDFNIIDEINYISISDSNYNKTSKIIASVENEIGVHNFSDTYDIGWNIKDFLIITINKYNLNITLNYKGKVIVLTEDKFNLFIKKNKIAILKAIKTLNIQYEMKLKNYSDSQELKVTEKVTEKVVLKTSKSDFKKMCEIFSIKKTQKQRYQIQSCKPFPEIHEWNL